MIIGEKIYSNKTKQTYTVVQTLKGGGQSEICYASSDNSSHIYFLKRFLNVKYSEKKHFKLKCQKFEDERNEIYSKINNYTLPNASCSFIYDFFREKSFYYVVTEKIDGFELCPNILATALTLEERLFLFRMIVYSFIPFERNDIIHADIKPDNILVSILNEHLVIRNIDFESSFFSYNPPRKGYIVGTEPYYSPELADYNNENIDTSNIKLTTKSDIFSLGVILYELLIGKYPKSARGGYLYEAVKNGEIYKFPNEWSDNLKILIRRMLEKEPSKRPTIYEILESLKQIPDISEKGISPVKPIVKIQKINTYEAKVTLFNLNRETKLFYSLNNSNIIEYTESFIISEDDITLMMKVCDLKGNEFIFDEMVSVSSRRYVRCKRPNIKISAGKVTINCDIENAIIYYTLNGNIPTIDDYKYEVPFEVSPNTTIKAIAKKVGYLSSEITSINSSSKIKIS